MRGENLLSISTLTVVAAFPNLIGLSYDVAGATTIKADVNETCTFQIHCKVTTHFFTTQVFSRRHIYKEVRYLYISNCVGLFIL